MSPHWGTVFIEMAIPRITAPSEPREL
jgi:hypothetical protein